ncbi:MAG TPA: FAD-binding protein [Candidatus Eisenbacteria bacterium]|nr:FAD-binding protein [Candidatus Eisenbacteria bacterium]
MGLIVVGASVGGLVAAITAADHGHRVVLLERAKELGGGAGTESETIAAAGTRFQRVADLDDAPDRLVADLRAVTRHHLEADETAALVAQSAALVEWLEKRCGVQVTLQSRTAVAGHSAPRLHAVGEQGGASLIATLVSHASRKTHIRVRAATEVERLTTDEAGAVTGIAVRPDRRGASIVTGPVVLACGGFVANDELIATHCPDVKDLPHLGAFGGRGEALRLAEPVGAATSHMGACAVTPFLAQPSHLAVPRAVVDLGGILVNQLGKRFADETKDALALALEIRAQPGKVAYLLFDERVMNAVAANDPFFARVVLPRTARRGSSVAMLAKQLELTEAGLALTLETYNANLGLGGDPFGRQRSRVALEAPFSGIRVTGARRATLGGLAVDAAGRVRHTSGVPIPGLFAVGGAASGLSGDGTDGGLVGMDALVTLGRARAAALALGSVADEGA